jgi:hypothetical protein
MSAPILALPPELLSQVFSYLNPFDLECVAKTLNRSFYGVAARLLKPHATWLRNARRMCSVFGRQSGGVGLLPSYPGHINTFKWDWSHRRADIPKNCYEWLGLHPAHGPYIRSSPPDLRGWMKLDGSFQWLAALDDETARQMAPHTGMEGQRSVAPDWQIDLVVKAAEELGLTLPQGFEKFVRSFRLHHRIPSFNAWYFRLSKLVKCPPEFDDDAGGYLQRFHCDQQHCAFNYLYMNPAGNHCVLHSSVDVYEALGIEESGIGHDDAVVDHDVGSNIGGSAEGDSGGDTKETPDYLKFENEQFHIVGLSFEEFLYTTYFEELLNFKPQAFGGLKHFVARVYRSAAEVAHMRESSG